MLILIDTGIFLEIVQQDILKVFCCKKECTSECSRGVYTAVVMDQNGNGEDAEVLKAQILKVKVE